MRLLFAAIFCLCMPILVASPSAFAWSKSVDLSDKVIEIVRENNPSPTPILGGWEYNSPKVEDADIEWNPSWFGNGENAKVFCMLLGLGEPMKYEGSLTPYWEWEVGRGGRSLHAGTDQIDVTQTRGRFRFDKIQCQEKANSNMAVWIEEYARHQNAQTAAK